MKYLVIVAILMTIFFAHSLQIASAGSFVFTENFDFQYKINSDNTHAKIVDGEVFIADNSISSRIESKTVQWTSYDISFVTLGTIDSIPNNTNIIYYISNNDGNTWRQVQAGVQYEFQNTGKRLRWAAVLARNSLDEQSPSIDSLTINIKEGGQRLQDRNDRKRTSALNAVSRAIKSFFNDRETYPFVNSDSPEARWQELGNLLERKGTNNRVFIYSMPQPIKAIDDSAIHYNYERLDGRYGNLTGEGYVLSTNLENGDNSKLRNDIDGTIGSTNCDDPVFCIISGVSINPVSQVEEPRVIDLSGVRLIRKNGGSKVFYITQNGQKRHVPNEEVFLSYGNRWADIVEVPENILQNYTDNKFIFLETKSPRQVYRIIGNKKILVSGKLLKNVQNREISPVNKTGFDYYQDISKKALLREQGSNTVFYISESGLKKAIPNEETFLSYGNKWDNIIVVPDGTLDNYPDVRFISSKTEPQKTYFIDGNKKQFVSASLFSTLNLKGHKVIQINKTDFNSYAFDLLNINKLLTFLGQ